MVQENHLGKPGFIENNIGGNEMEILKFSPQHQALLQMLWHLAQLWFGTWICIWSPPGMTCIFIFAILFPTISMSDPQSIPVRATLLPCYRWRNSPQKLTDLIPKSIFHELHRSVRLGMTLDPKVATDAILGTTDRYASFYALIGDFIWFGHWSISVSRSFFVVAMGWKIQRTKTPACFSVAVWAGESLYC